jgi:uncharacterized UPF0160 family protein
MEGGLFADWLISFFLCGELIGGFHHFILSIYYMKGILFMQKFVAKGDIPNCGFTHGGVFHADDVFSTALLKILNPNIVIQRGNKVPDNFDGIVYDIGHGEFDHHQPDNEIRPNGVPYASFGKLWRKYGTLLFSQKECNLFDIGFVQAIDENDNLGGKDSVSTIISSMNPNWDSNKTDDECFEDAVRMAKRMLLCQFDSIRAKERAKPIVLRKIKESRNGILILDTHMPYREEAISHGHIKLVIYPSKRGGYNIQVVTKSFKNTEPRVSFPKHWLGADEETLNQYVKGMFFCHKSNYIASTYTKEQAINVAKTVLNIK